MDRGKTIGHLEYGNVMFDSRKRGAIIDRGAFRGKLLSANVIRKL